MNVTCEHCGAANPSAAHDAHQVSASCLTVQLKRERAEVERLRGALGERDEGLNISFAQALVELRQACGEAARKASGSVEVGHAVGNVDILPILRATLKGEEE